MQIRFTALFIAHVTKPRAALQRRLCLKRADKLNTPTDMTGLPAFSQRFKACAELECQNSSPLYEHLSHGIAADEEVLALAAYCRKGQPAPNLFLGAVHFLLLQEVAHPLAQFYPDLSDSAAQSDAAYPAFREFCLSHRTQLIEIISSRLVQTNEIRRCSYLFPAFNLISELAHNRPLSLVEVGTSAGLNLIWDAYGYRCRCGQDVIEAANRGSSVQIECSLRGNNRPNFPSSLPRVLSRTGIDLNIIDLSDETESLWLRALIWPEHRERVELLQDAAPIVQQAPLRLLSGDAVVLLPEVLEEVSPDAALVVFHTHTINQFPLEARERLTTIIERAAAKREVFRLANDIGGGGSNYSALQLIELHNGERIERHLANVDAHGQWLEWLACLEAA